MNVVLKFKQSKILNNMGWMIGERIFQLCISLFVGVFTARFLGPSNYGILSYSMSIIIFFNSICTLGLESIIVKEIIDNPEKEGVILGSGIMMRLVSSILSIILIILIINIINAGNNILIIVTIIQSLSLIFKVFDLIDFWFQSKLNSKYVVIAKTISYLIISLWKVSLLFFKASIKWFAFSIVIEAFVLAVILLYLYYKKSKQKLKVSYYVALGMLRKSYHFIISGMLITIYTQIDKIMIGNLLNEESVGIYSIAITLSTMWYFIPNSIISSFRPVIIKAKEINNNEYILKLKQLYAIIIWSGIIVGIFFTIFSKIIITILYGEAFIDAYRPLSIMIWSGIFALLGTARGIWMISENLNRYIKTFTLGGAIVNILLNTILIKSIGINGAAIATLISQAVVAFIGPIMLKETRESPIQMIEALCLKNIGLKSKIWR